MFGGRSALALRFCREGARNTRRPLRREDRSTWTVTAPERRHVFNQYVVRVGDGLRDWITLAGAEFVIRAIERVVEFSQKVVTHS